MPTVAFEPVTAEELEFPLAFSHQVHKEFGIFEMFLMLMYRPHNFHCIHVDKKASAAVRRTVETIVNCYQSKFSTDSIFIAEESIPVFWGHMSVLEADFICMRELLRKSTRWKFVATLAGTEMPMVSYQEFRQLLESVPQGESLYFSGLYPAHQLKRIQESHHLYWFVLLNFIL